MNLLMVILFLFLQSTEQLNTVNYSNKNCGKSLIGLVQQQQTLEEVNLANALEKILRGNKRKRTKKSDQAMLIPMLLMSNEAFTDITGTIFHFVLLILFLQSTGQFELNTVKYSNKNCDKSSVGLVQQQPKLDEIDLANALEKMLRGNKRKKTKKRDQAMFIPMLLMSNEAFKGLKDSNFNFKDIQTFSINQQ